MPDWAKASLARGATIFFPDGAPGDASAPKDALKAPRPYEFPLWKKPAQPDDAPTVATGGLSTGGTVADDCSVGSERSAALSEAGSVSTVATALPVAPIAVDLATSGTYRPEPAADDARATAAVSPDRDADSVRTFDSPAVLRGPAPSASPQHRAPDADAPPRPAERKAGAWDQATPRPPPEAVATPQPMHWRRGEQLGEGTFGKVYLALNERNGELFACKRIGLAPDAGAAELHELESEIRLLKTIDHKHFGVFSEVLIRIYVTQILRGVRYLHDRKIVHRDIKGGNVLVNDSGVAKLADFGCSKQLQGMRTGTLEQSLQAIQGSVPWMAPEVIKQSGHGRGADVWSVGATIATSTEPPPCPDSLSPAAKAFIDRCLQIDPKDRATAKELLADDFVMNSP
ncbi:MAP kinase kinase kinase [Aureococcus anophagefferens]|nr:MAP kinase kinase kinase [Aureococcus anophagefferens]